MFPEDDESIAWALPPEEWDDDFKGISSEIEDSPTKAIGLQTNQASRLRSAKVLGWQECSILRTALECVFILLVSSSAIDWRRVGTASTCDTQRMLRASRQPSFLDKTGSKRSLGISSRKYYKSYSESGRRPPSEGSKPTHKRPPGAYGVARRF